MIPAFADTYYYIALTNTKDASHAKSMAFAQTSRRPMITTAWIVTELADAMAAVNNRPLFAKLHSAMLRSPMTTIVPADQALMDRGLKLFAARPDKDWSLTDCISFVVTQENGLTEALAPG